MDYKAFEEMTGGIPEKTEMDKLIGYLKIFPPVKYTYSIVKFADVLKSSLWMLAQANESRIVSVITRVMDIRTD